MENKLKLIVLEFRVLDASVVLLELVDRFRLKDMQFELPGWFLFR